MNYELGIGSAVAPKPLTHIARSVANHFRNESGYGIREVDVRFAADNRHGNPVDENTVDYACLEFDCLPTELSHS